MRMQISWLDTPDCAHAVSGEVFGSAYGNPSAPVTTITPCGADPDPPIGPWTARCVSPARARERRCDPIALGRDPSDDRQLGSIPLRAACQRPRTAPQSRPVLTPRTVR